MNYYYFAATLPALSLDAAPPLSLADFRRLCTIHLSRSDNLTLQALLEGDWDSNEHPFLQQWRAFDTYLRNAAVKERATRLKTDPSVYIRVPEGADAFLQRRVADAFSRPDPLSRELALDRIRWSAAADLAGFRPLAVETIFAYAIRLRMAERWAQMNQAAGEGQLDRLINRPATGASTP
jgi:hypothetical protein